MSFGGPGAAASAAKLGSLFSARGEDRSLAYTSPKEPSADRAADDRGAADCAATKGPSGAAKEPSGGPKAPRGASTEPGAARGVAAAPNDAAAAAATAQTAAAPAVRYAYAGRARLYRLDGGAYAAVHDGEPLGFVLLGAPWVLLVYDAAKKHVLQVGVGDVAGSLECLADGYISFFAKGLQWSALFDTPTAVRDFARAVALCARKGGRVPLSYSPSAATVQPGDTCTIAFKKWQAPKPGELPTALDEAPKTGSCTVVAGAVDFDEFDAAALIGATNGSVQGLAHADGAWVEVQVDAIVAAVPLALAPPAPILPSPPPSPPDDSTFSVSARVAAVAAGGGVRLFVMTLESRSRRAAQGRAPREERL
ncbi:hypothetical protein M885DRAFT_465977 [Pelagophyceae sp. CCMP2097]|nr:hypothetical protein M885DRAFT_465977 [Pelagophyceae sp. CCMP2097]